jgi:hypothetical protein
MQRSDLNPSRFSAGASTYAGISPPGRLDPDLGHGIVVEGVCESTVEEVQAASSPNILSAQVAAPSGGMVRQFRDLQEKAASIPDQAATACLGFQALSVSILENKRPAFAGLSWS